MVPISVSPKSVLNKTFVAVAGMAENMKKVRHTCVYVVKLLC